MKTPVKRGWAAVAVLLIGGSPVLAMAQDDAGSPTSPLKEGPYIAPMASYINTDGPHTDDGFGGVLAAGYRFERYAIEVKGNYHVVDSDTGDVDYSGFSVGGLLFPFASLPNLYGIVELGAQDLQHYPSEESSGLLGLQTTLQPRSVKIGRAVQQECRDRSRMPSSA
eukprot:TRINITY_DN103993_c0_g1_i3.p1 TRINITY_DN103993_c0_g1~~TRINITY_DN103993_c0_g1_i3.p1  ORF type:complete len:194 (+),score=42.79 TRINITY_DN103993_c0_g1_i3:84-584(+)